MNYSQESNVNNDTMSFPDLVPWEDLTSGEMDDDDSVTFDSGDGEDDASDTSLSLSSHSGNRPNEGETGDEMWFVRVENKTITISRMTNTKLDGQEVKKDHEALSFASDDDDSSSSSSASSSSASEASSSSDEESVSDFPDSFHVSRVKSHAHQGFSDHDEASEDSESSVESNEELSRDGSSSTSSAEEYESSSDEEGSDEESASPIQRSPSFGPVSRQTHHRAREIFDSQSSEDKTLLVVCSIESADSETAMQQQNVLEILKSNDIPHQIMDADDPGNRPLRDSLFALSGFSHYPQLFVHMDGETSYWGDWDDLMADSEGNETEVFELTDESDVESVEESEQVQFEFELEREPPQKEEDSQDVEAEDARSEEDSPESEEESDESSVSTCESEATPVETASPLTPVAPSIAVLSTPPSPQVSRTQNTSADRTVSVPVKTPPSSRFTSRNALVSNTSPVMATNSSPSERLGGHATNSHSPKIMSSNKLGSRDAMIAKTAAVFEKGSKAKKGSVGGKVLPSKTSPSQTKASTTSVKKSVSAAPEKVQVENPVMNCYAWYSRLGSPSRAVFEKRVATLPASCGVYPEHVDLLPWNSTNTTLEFRAARNLMLGKPIDQ